MGSYSNGTAFNTARRTHVLEMTFFYDAGAESHSDETVLFNMVWRTHALRMILLTSPARGFIETAKFSGISFSS